MKNRIKKIQIKCDPLIDFTLLVKNKEKHITCKSIDFQSDTTSKIDLIYIARFINDLCFKLGKNDKIFYTKKYTNINLSKHYFVLENIRDIYSGALKNIISDNTKSKSEKLISFGYVDSQKPQRIKFMKMCNYINEFNYIKTKKFNAHETKKFKTIIEYKQDCKYFIDLAGHTYSTKSLLFLASKRVFFSSKHPETTGWEKKYLKPWENYIPVNEDLSDLEQKYILLQSTPFLYKKIIENNISLLKNELSSDAMMQNLIHAITNPHYI